LSVNLGGSAHDLTHLCVVADRKKRLSTQSGIVLPARTNLIPDAIGPTMQMPGNVLAILRARSTNRLSSGIGRPATITPVVFSKAGSPSTSNMKFPRTQSAASVTTKSVTRRNGKKQNLWNTHSIF
jgi:hypothetical protein